MAKIIWRSGSSLSIVKYGFNTHPSQTFGSECYKEEADTRFEGFRQIKALQLIM